MSDEMLAYYEQRRREAWVPEHRNDRRVDAPANCLNAYWFGEPKHRAPGEPR